MNKRVSTRGKLRGIKVDGKIINCQEHDSIDINTGKTFNSHSWIARSIMDVLNK